MPDGRAGLTSPGSSSDVMAGAADRTAEAAMVYPPVPMAVSPPGSTAR